MRVSSNLFSSLLLGSVPLLGGCTMDYTLIPWYSTQLEVSGCLPDEIGSYDNSSYADGWAGLATDIMSFGVSPSVLDSRRLLALGMPGGDSDDLEGRVVLREINIAGGGLLTSGAATQTIAPPTSGVTRFGRATFAHDIRQCHTESSYYKACGQELLIGAPRVDAAGQVYWYRSDTSLTNSLLSYGGAINDPTASDTGLFGFSIAGPETVLDANAPWNTSANAPGWVAIGAPGDNKVYLYAISPTSGTPLTHRQTITGPSGGLFGYSIATGDVNGDGVQDLVVGAPEDVSASNKGHVVVYLGLSAYDPASSTSMPVSSTYTVVSAPSTIASGSRFGMAVATGRFWDSYADRDALLLGAPEHDDGTALVGAACQVVFTNAGAVDVIECFDNPHAATTNENFGAAVAVGNFYNVDGGGAMSTPAARLEEVAISRPGWDTGKGIVTVYPTDADGVGHTNWFTTLQDHTGVANGARFGTTMRSGYGQTQHWEDLAIGAPLKNTLDGTVTLTKAPPIDEADLDGVWELEDYNGTPHQVRISSVQNAASADMTVIEFIDDYPMELRDNFGAGTLCVATEEDNTPMSFDIPAGTRLTMMGHYPSGSSYTWVDVSAGPFIMAVLDALEIDYTGYETPISWQVFDVELSFTSGTPSTGSVSFDLDKLSWVSLEIYPGIDEECRPAGAPFDMEQLSDGVCE